MKRGLAFALLCFAPGIDGWVTIRLLRFGCSHRYAVRHAPRDMRLQLFPGDDPYEQVRQAARKRAALELAAEAEETGLVRSDKYKWAYAEAMADIDVEEIMEARGEISSPLLAPPPAAADESPSNASDGCVKPVMGSLTSKERLIDEIANAGGVSVLTDDQIAVYHSLPLTLQQALHSGDMGNLKLAIGLMSIEEVEHHSERCRKVGIW